MSKKMHAFVAIALVMTGCASGTSTAESSATSQPASAPSGRFVVVTAEDGAVLPSRGVIARGPAGRAALLKGSSAPAQWTVLGRLDEEAKRKLVSASELLSALETGQRLPVYLGLDAATAPSGVALEAALREVGFELSTVSGDVLTGKQDPRRMTEVVQLSWVRSITAAGKVRPKPGS